MSCQEGNQDAPEVPTSVALNVLLQSVLSGCVELINHDIIELTCFPVLLAN